MGCIYADLQNFLFLKIGEIKHFVHNISSLSLVLVKKNCRWLKNEIDWLIDSNTTCNKYLLSHLINKQRYSTYRFHLSIYEIPWLFFPMIPALLFFYFIETIVGPCPIIWCVLSRTLWVMFVIAPSTVKHQSYASKMTFTVSFFKEICMLFCYCGRISRMPKFIYFKKFILNCIWTAVTWHRSQILFRI